MTVTIDGVEVEHKGLVFEVQREAAKKITTEFRASFEIMGSAFRRALPGLRQLMPLLSEIEREQQRRRAAMQAWSRRKGRKK